MLTSQAEATDALNSLNCMFSMKNDNDIVDAYSMPTSLTNVTRHIILLRQASSHGGRLIMPVSIILRLNDSHELHSRHAAVSKILKVQSQAWSNTVETFSFVKHSRSSKLSMGNEITSSWESWASTSESKSLSRDDEFSSSLLLLAGPVNPLARAHTSSLCLSSLPSSSADSSSDSLLTSGSTVSTPFGFCASVFGFCGWTFRPVHFYFYRAMTINLRLQEVPLSMPCKKSRVPETKLYSGCVPGGTSITCEIPQKRTHV